MTTSTWHAGEQMLAEYVAGALDALSSASVEQHLLSCPQCRALVRPMVDVPALDVAWLGVRNVIERPKLPVTMRVARRLGLSEPNAVLLAATASLRTAWWSSSFVAIGFAVLAARIASDDDGIWAFLLVAPLVPVIGVGMAYGPSEDPLDTLLVATPYGRTRLILWRTVAVIVSTLPFAFLVGLGLPGPLWIAAAWLGPALMLIPIVMALGTFVGPSNAAAVIALAWTGLVLASVRHHAPTQPVQPTQQLVYLVLALIASSVLAVRLRRPDVKGTEL